MTQTPDSRPETLPETAELFHLIVENVKDYAIFMTDAEGIVVSWNPGVERLLGYTESEIVGQPISLIFTPEDCAAGAHLKEIETAASAGRAEDKRWHLRKDSSRFWANGMAMLLKNADGTVRGFAKVMRDETPRKLAEENLVASNRRTETILSSITDAFYTFDRDLRYVYVNEASTKMFGLSEAEFLGKTLSDLFPDVEGSVFHREIGLALADGKPRVFENYYQPLDRWFENRVYPSDDGLSVFTAEITTRKQSEAALATSDERYRMLFDSIDEGFCIIEMIYDREDNPIDWLFVEANPAFEKNNSIKDVVGKTILELAPGIEPKWFEIYNRIALTGEPERFAEGSEALNTWFDVYAFSIGETEERKLAVLFTDITARKQSEIAVRRSEEQFRSFVSTSSDTLYKMSADWSQMYSLDGRDFLADTEKTSGVWLENYIPPEDYPQVLAAVRQAIENKSAFELEHRVIRADGSVGWTFSRAVPLLGATGEIVEWFGAATDITRRREAEAEREKLLKIVEAERARLAYIFDKAPAFVAVLSGAEHIFETTNPAYLQLIGHRNVGGKTVREALPDIAGQGYYERLDRVYQSGEPFIGSEMAVELQHAPGSQPEKRFVNFVFQPIFDADRKSTGIFVHGVDITEQVRARREAEDANRMKDEFLATLSHELRTPLNAILGWSQMLQTRNLGEVEAKKALSTIERNARAQNQLIDDILDVSRIITGKLRLDVQAVDLSNVIAAAVDAARPGAEAKNIRLQILLDPSAGPISGDPDRLQQVVWNLLSNAVKFTPKDGRVQARLERINSHVEITVSDTGAGIEAEFLPHVFDRFRQSDGSMTRRHGGLGLGLAIVRQIVELHGGTVSVMSDGENQGSTFTVQLPLLPVRREPASGNDAPRVHPAAQTGASRDCPPELSGLRVLLVDDEADSRDLLNFVLDSCGAQVTTANSASEAFAALSRQKFDVLVSDIGMPEEDGFSLVQKIRALPAELGGTIPAIALTAYARAEDRIKSLRLGFQMHIPKPVENLELITAVANLAGRIERMGGNGNAES